MSRIRWSVSQAFGCIIMVLCDEMTSVYSPIDRPSTHLMHGKGSISQYLRRFTLMREQFEKDLASICYPVERFCKYIKYRED